MSRYLFRRRLTIVAALAAVVVLVPLIGWISHALALKAARDSRPPARLRWTAVTVGRPPQFQIEIESDAAYVVLDTEYLDGMGRTIHYAGGSGVGEWEYDNRSVITFDGRLDGAAVAAGEWLPLRHGDKLLLGDGDITKPNDGPATLKLWCLPERFNLPRFRWTQEDRERWEADRDAWLLANPP